MVAVGLRGDGLGVRLPPRAPQPPAEETLHVQRGAGGDLQLAVGSLLHRIRAPLASEEDGRRPVDGVVVLLAQSLTPGGDAGAPRAAGAAATSGGTQQTKLTYDWLLR